jgi:5-formyltetrahydrofolate cyclo-ligase
LVAFDSQGHRLGMGGGYYDRTFSFLKDKIHHKPKLLGLAYDFQQVEQLPYEEWDIRLDYAVTESLLFNFTRSQL